MIQTAKALFGLITKTGGFVEAGPGANLAGVRARRRDGSEADLAAYRGQVLLIVNVASKCGCTPQYNDLAALHARHKDRGFAVLGFPCNDFAGQEPGAADEVAAFCSMKFGVEFEIFEKVHVKGSEQAPLYARLTGAENGPYAGAIGWNFTKFLVDRDGVVQARCAPHINPADPRLDAAIQRILGPA